MNLDRFEKLWNLVVPQVIELCIEEVDSEFMKKRNLHVCDLKRLKQEVGSFYFENSELLKLNCYTNEEEENLDLHKLAAIFCAALLKYKPVVFDDYLEEKSLPKIQGSNSENGGRQTTRTQFIINNYLVNYKIAFYVATTIVYYDLINRVSEDEAILNQIISMKNLTKYPSNKTHTPFENSFIIELARNDYADREFDFFFFALAMFQWQEYTRLKALNNLAVKK